MTVTDVVIVGCGLIGTKRARAAAEAGARVVAVFDTDTERAVELARGLPGEVAVSTTLHDTLARASGGLAVVATTHDALATTASTALEAGCHVLIEKPGARSVEELRTVGEVAEAAGLVVRVGFNHRFHPGLLRLRELVRSGRFGEVMVIRGRYGHGGRIGYASEWRAKREMSGGGELLDQGVHLLDLTRFVAGATSLEYASVDTLFWPMEVEDNAFLHLRLATGGHAWHHASWTEWKNIFSFEVACRTGKLEVGGLGGSYGPERLTVYEMSSAMGPPPATAYEWPPSDISWSAEMQDVLTHLDGHPAVGATIDDALAVLTTVQEAYDS